MKEASIFEKIINKDIPSFIIHEDDKFIVILDINPINNGHSLIIPKNKKDNILMEEENIFIPLFNVAKKISNKLMNKLNASGIKMVINNGKSAGQEVFHTHMHIIPYYDDNVKKLSIEEIFNILK